MIQYFDVSTSIATSLLTHDDQIKAQVKHSQGSYLRLCWSAHLSRHSSSCVASRATDILNMI